MNFQPEASTTVPPGYRADIGRSYGRRANGLTYGWTRPNEVNARNSDSFLSPDERFDTFNHMPDGVTWSVAVPNGRYEVHIVAGDAKHTDSVFKIFAEGVRAVDGVPRDAWHPWVEGTAICDVADGILTINNGHGAYNGKLSFVEITSVAPEVAAEAPVVSFSDNSADASEGHLDKGTWVVSRSGPDLSQPLVVNYTLSGSATNGVDYETLGGTLTIAAGATSANLIVRPKQDSAVEGTEQVIATLAPGTGYTLGGVTTATCSLSDDDHAPSGVLGVKWSSAPSAALGRVEPGVVQVGSRLFVIGGFDEGRELGVTRRVDIFDLSTGKWSSGAQLPSGAAQTHGGLASDGKFIYLVSGQVGDGYNTGTVRSYRYDIAGNTWSRWVDFPTIRYGGALVYLGGKLYYFGGDKADRATVSRAYWVCDTTAANPKWTQVGNLPLSGDHLGHAILNNKIYIVGGEHGHAGVDFHPEPTYTQHKYLLEYDPQANTFTRKADMPVAASHFEGAIHAINGKIAIFGGNSGKERQTNKVQVWDSITNKWTLISDSVPDARQGAASGIYNGRIYYADGYSGSLGITTRAYWGTLSGF